MLFGCLSLCESFFDLRRALGLALLNPIAISFGRYASGLVADQHHARPTALLFQSLQMPRAHVVLEAELLLGEVLIRFEWNGRRFRCSAHGGILVSSNAPRHP